MVRAPFMDSNGIRKGAWSPEEDNLLKAYIERFGHSNWRALPKLAGLSRCGKSCRLRWMNYLRPGVKRGNYSKQEEELIIQMHNRYGNKWSKISEQLPGRTDNEIKNYWHTNQKNKKKQRSVDNEVNEKYPTKKLNYVASPPPILESSSYSSNVSCESGNLITEDSQTSFDQDYSSEFDRFWSQPFVADQLEYNYQTFFPSYEDSFDLFYQIMQELPPI